MEKANRKYEKYSRRSLKKSSYTGAELEIEDDPLGMDVDESDGPRLDKHSMDYLNVMAGVSVTWLHQVFRQDKPTIKKKIVGVKPIKHVRGGFPVYDLRDVVPYLIPPAERDLRDYIKKMSKADLPVYMQDEFWAAQLKRQKWEENAGDLWRTEDVLDALAEVFKTIKESTRLWGTTVEQMHGTTKEQREALATLVDTLLVDINEKITEATSKKSTGNSLVQEENGKREDAAIS